MSKPLQKPKTYADVLATEGKAKAANVFTKTVEARIARDAAEKLWRQAQKDSKPLDVVTHNTARELAAATYGKGILLLRTWHQAVKKTDLDVKKFAKITSSKPSDNADLIEIFQAGASEYFVAEGKKQFARAAKQSELLLGNIMTVALTRKTDQMLNTQVWSWGVNQAFIEGGASVKATFTLVTPLAEAIVELLADVYDGAALVEAAQKLHSEEDPTDPLWHHGENRPTWYLMELAGLVDLGYTINEGGSAFTAPATVGAINVATQKIGADTYLRSIDIPLIN